ncbi:STAS domain-containing protein [Candidatus Peregrinibacteria bacterium]|nr:STAS domain-containing protein [Candidatus Peregrinibacteria bacterium]
MSPVTPPKVNIVINPPDAEHNYQTVSLEGEIDRDTLPSLREDLEVFLASFQGTNLVFDFQDLLFINSEGIGYLSDIHNRFELLNKHVFIINTSARIMDIFQLVGLNQIIPCVNSIDELLAKIKIK